MARGPTKGSKRYTCRNEACERFGRIQYLAPWANKRCRHCGSENIEEVKSRVGEKPKPPGLPPSPAATSATPQEPSVEPPAEPPSVEAGVEIGEEAKLAPPSDVADETEGDDEDKDAAPKDEPAAALATPPAQPVTTIDPKNGDLVYCKKCGWAVYWNDEYHTKSACHAAGCGSTNIAIKMPVEGK